MDGRIEHLRGHYRFGGSRVAATGFAARLDRVLPDSGVASYEAAIQEILGEDESVYVLRRVRAQMSLALNEDVTDAALARFWGTRVANSVLRAIAARGQSSENVVRFENQADYVAHFLIALLRGTQHGQWFFRAFAELTKLDRDSAIKQALLDHRAQLPAILGYVQRYGALDSLIAAVDAETRRKLWSADSDAGAEQRNDVELSRPLFILALQFVDKLDSWARVPRDGEELFRIYLETEPPAADWRDPRSLAVYVFEVVRFLFVRGYLVISTPQSSEFRSRLVSAMKDLSWLDQDWLEVSVVNLFGRSPDAMEDLPVRPLRGTPTPRQRALLSDIADALSKASDANTSAALSKASDANTSATLSKASDANTSAALSKASDLNTSPALSESSDANSAVGLSDAGIFALRALDPEAARLKLWGLLVAASPAWADDTAGKVLVQNLISTWTAMREASAPAEFLKRLRRGDVNGALRLLDPEPSAQTSDACRQVANLGKPALALVQKLGEGSAAEPDTFEGVESNCAGVSLILRSILEARLQILAHSEAYPRNDELPHVVMMMLLIGARLGGKSDVTQGCFNEDICLLAGLDRAPNGDALAASWSKLAPSDHFRFQIALLKLSAGQRLVKPETMHAFIVKLANGKQALVAGDETGTVWPLGRLINSEGEIAVVLCEWQRAWKKATGIAPRVVTGDSVIRAIVEHEPNLSLSSDPEMLQTHDSGHQELLAALDALQRGQTGEADLDLTITIVSCVLLRVWARWLRGFSTSSVQFLIENFMRRRGQLQLQSRGLIVALERGPLDIVIEMAGYLSDLENVPWLPGGRARFLLKERR